MGYDKHSEIGNKGLNGLVSLFEFDASQAVCKT